MASGLGPYIKYSFDRRVAFLRGDTVAPNTEQGLVLLSAHGPSLQDLNYIWLNHQKALGRHVNQTCRL